MPLLFELDLQLILLEIDLSSLVLFFFQVNVTVDIHHTI